MTRKYCDCCSKEIHGTLSESTTFVLKLDSIMALSVLVTTQRSRDLCIPCRRKIVAEGMPSTAPNA